MAMSFGRPVLASNIPGMTDIVRDGENGYLFDSGDYESLANKLKDIFSDLPKLRQCSLNGRKLMEEESGWNMIGKLTSELYKGLCHDTD